MPNLKAKTKKLKTLHLGCGASKKPGSIGVDINRKSSADVVHDLNKFPYPFSANQFGLVIAENILEHLDNIPKVMEEIYRICKNGARVKITASHFTSVDSFTDPTHKHFFTSRSFDYFIPGEDLYKYNYSRIKFKKIKVAVGPLFGVNLILKFLLKVINKFMIFYEKRLAFIFPVGTIYYELEVIKN